MRIIFKQVKWKNLMSYGSGESVLDIDSHQLTLIIGKNGHGKSAIIEAIFYALFGKAYRKVNLAQLINTMNGKKLEVELTLIHEGDTYRIVRCMKPNVFEIYKNGELISEEASGIDYQGHIERLGLNYKTFKQVCVIGSSSYVQFMSLGASDRRGIIEDLLDVGIFSEMSKIAKSENAELVKKRDSISMKIDNKVSELQRLERILGQMVESERARETEYSEKIQRLTDSISECQTTSLTIAEKISKLTNDIGHESEVREKYDESRSSLGDIIKSMKAEKEAISFFVGNNVCPTCMQPITEDFKDGKVHDHQNNIAELKSNGEKIAADIKNLEWHIDKISEINSEISRLNKELNEINSQIRSMMSSKTLLMEDMKKPVESNRVQNEIDSVKMEGKSLSSDMSIVETDVRYMSECVNMLKDTGIKARCVAFYIPLINQIINEYLGIFDLFVDFELDENFNETIRSRYRDTFTYDSFSEGEKQKIDLSILFAWRKIAQERNSLSTNLLFFDETLDSSLDAESTECFLNVLRQENSNIFVISHRGADHMMFDRVLQATKKADGYSVLEEV